MNDKLLKDFPVRVSQPIQWGDMDAMRHVNNTIFLRWFENGRISYFQHLPVFQSMDGHSAGPILASVTCHFRRQVTYPDAVIIGTRVSRIGRTSMTMEHHIASEQKGQIVADGESIIVAVDYATHKTIEVPSAIREAIAKIEGKPIGAEPAAT